jgi:hypothetical protein
MSRWVMNGMKSMVSKHWLAILTIQVVCAGGQRERGGPMDDVLILRRDKTPEVHDDHGCVWAWFESPAGKQCALCGRTITRGWACADGRHVCLDHVIVAGDTFTVNELAIAARISKRAMRTMLNDAGTTPPLEERSTDPVERVSRQVVTRLVAMLAGDRVGGRLSQLLSNNPAE